MSRLIVEPSLLNLIILILRLNHYKLNKTQDVCPCRKAANRKFEAALWTATSALLNRRLAFLVAETKHTLFFKKGKMSFCRIVISGTWLQKLPLTEGVLNLWGVCFLGWHQNIRLE